MLEPWLADGAERDVAARAERDSRAHGFGGDGGRPHCATRSGRPLVGHFGTYGGAAGALLDRTLQDLAVLSDCHVLLLGEGSEPFLPRADVRTSLACRTGCSPPAGFTADDVSHHVAACDVMLQPYPDGISSRRTSAMVALVARPCRSSRRPGG